MASFQNEAELLAQLPEPKSIWQYFFEICKVPHGSNNMDGIRARLVELGREIGCETQVDAGGNIIIRKPGVEGKPGVCMQGHMDMVNQKTDASTHNFETDPIQPRIVGPLLKATDTSLGADNGIGVALGLAIMADKSLSHPPLELLITKDEEIGLIGAAQLEPGLLRSKYLINIDSEEEYALCIGCAGGFQINIDVPATRVAPTEGHVAFRLYLQGLKGGHSGCDIHLGRGNALKVLPRILLACKTPYQLVTIDGGSVHNAIPRSADAVVYVSESDAAAFRAEAEAEFAAFAHDYKDVEPAASLEITPIAAPMQPLDAASTERVLDFLNLVPYGPARMSPVVEGLVETSFTLAICKSEEGKFSCVASARSSSKRDIDYLFRQIASLTRVAGATLSERMNEYPGWAPDTTHALFHAMKETHNEVLGREPHIYAVHAGLECGLIKDKYPEMDMISIGPEIKNPHSPDEQLLIDSVPRNYNLLVGALAKLAQ